MKVPILVISVFVLISCSGSNTEPNDDTTFGQNNLSKRKYQLIEKDSIDKIVLLIADTSIIDPPNKELPDMLRIHSGSGFVDSTGRPIFKPTQEIIIKGSTKDKFIGVFNSYLEIPQDTTIGTRCVVLYRHCFLLYDQKGKMSEQINLCLDCTKLDFLHRNAFIQFLDNRKMLFIDLIQNLNLTGAYVPAKLRTFKL